MQMNKTRRKHGGRREAELLGRITLSLESIPSFSGSDKETNVVMAQIGSERSLARTRQIA